MKLKKRNQQAPHIKLRRRRYPALTRLGLKLSLLILMITVSADVLSFTARIAIDMVVSNGSSDTENIIAAVVSSIVIGTLLSFIAGSLFLKPLAELIRATKRVSEGDYTVQVDMGWAEKHTVRELSDLIRVFNEMTRELNSTAMFNNDFIASFSHEFKTPLVSIRGFAQQLYEGNLTPEQQKEFSRIILEETDYLTGMSANTLLLTKLETSEVITEKKNFWMAAVPATFMSAVSCTYFILAPECLGSLLNSKTADGTVIYNTAVAYSIGIVFAALLLALFIRATKKRSAKKSA